MKIVNIIKPPQIAGLLLGLSIALHFLLSGVFRYQFACLACGVIAIGFGFGLMTWAWWLFRQACTPIRPTDRATTLVRSGPFRFTRNPMYLGISLILLGIAVSVGSFPMLVAPLGFFAFMSLVFIPYEEQRLREIFGKDYVTYTQEVRRWI